MQIRKSKSGKKIELLRSKYSPEKKRCVYSLITSFESWKDDLPEESATKLTPEEREEVQAWLDQRRIDRAASTIKLALKNLPERLEDSVAAIEKFGTDSEHAATLYAGMSQLNKALKKAGFKKPVKEKKPKTKKKSKAKKAKSAKRKKTLSAK